METNTEHDFKAPIEKTSVELAKSVLEDFMNNFDILVYEDREMTNEEESALREKGTDFAIGIISKMANTDIPADYASYCIDKIVAALQSVKMYVDGTVRQMHDEVLARTFGAKSPVTNTFATDVATLAQVSEAVKKLRETTEGEYFIEKKD